MDGRWPSSERHSTIGSDCATKQRCSSGPRHPGVVELVDIDHGNETTTLSTAWLGGGSLGAAEMAPKKLAGVGAKPPMTIADLHNHAIVHRRITSDHVLLDGLGQVVLVGFGNVDVAGRVRRRRRRRCHRGGARGEAPDRPRRAREGADEPGRPPGRRAAPRCPRPRTDPEPSRRPSARALSACWPRSRVSRSVVGRSGSRDRRRLTALPRPRPTHSPLRTPRLAPPSAGSGRELATRAWAILLALAATLIVGFGARATLASGNHREQPRPRPAPWCCDDSNERGRRRIQQHQLTAGVADIGALPSTRASRRAADVDGDGCPEAVRIDGAQVVVDGARYDVGAPGDAVAVADWGCDGTDTPAVVRPSTATSSCSTHGRPPTHRCRGACWTAGLPARSAATPNEHVRSGAGRGRHGRAISRGARSGGSIDDARSSIDPGAAHAVAALGSGSPAPVWKSALPWPRGWPPRRSSRRSLAGSRLRASFAVATSHRCSSSARCPGFARRPGARWALRVGAGAARVALRRGPLPSLRPLVGDRSSPSRSR